MSDLVGNPEDQFSHNEAQIRTISHVFISKLSILQPFILQYFVSRVKGVESAIVLQGLVFIDLMTGTPAVVLGCRYQRAVIMS